MDDLRKLIQEKGLQDKVTLRGLVTDRSLLSDYYAASDLFLFPSLYDNAPLVVREAAAMGTPAILIEGSTASEVVSDGKNGFLTDRSPASFATLIEAIDKDRDMLSRVASGARSTLVRSWEDVVDEVVDRYDVLIKNFKR